MSADESEAGRQGRDEGMARAEGAADSEWKAAAIDAVEQLAHASAYLTSDDVWPLLFAQQLGTHEHRAMGPVMQSAKRLGLIEATAAFRPSTRAKAHAGPKRVWRSLVFKA